MTNFQKQFISLTILLILFAGLFCVSWLTINPVQAKEGGKNITDQMKSGLEFSNLPGRDENPEEKSLKIVGSLINAFLSLFGILFLILMIYGGYKWMLASGREDEVKSAKDIIRSAIIGLIIVMLAYGISYFVSLALEKSTAGVI